MKLHFLLIAIVIAFCSTSFAQDKKQKRQDNEKPKFYKPVIKDVEGWSVAFDPRLLKETNKDVFEKALKALSNHLQRIEFMLPEKQLKRIKLCKIWVELENSKTSGMQYHPGRGWLLANGLDPALVKHVHVARARDLYSKTNWSKHPYVILHELAHSYHDQVYGFQNKKIKDVFEKAKASKTYDKILDHRGRQVRHYGMNNQMEYFAESTEAYLGVNDFYPFVRAELKEHDPDMYKLLSEIWGTIR